MAFLPKRLQSKFDSKLYDSKPQLNPTEALDAIEKALQTVLSRYGNERHFGSGRQADEINKEHTVKLGFETLAHLATLRQQVADLVAMTTNQPTDEKLDDLVEWIRQYVEANKDQCSGGTGMAEMDAREIREAVRSRIKQRILSMFTVHLAADGGQGA